MCYVTDNGGGGPWDNDVDGGYTILSSPIFNLSSYSNPYIDYYRWFYNGGTSNGAPNDTMKIMLSNGITSTVLETILPGTSGNSTWVNKKFKVSNYLTPTANMQIKYYIVDAPPANIVEGDLDKFKVIDSTLSVGIVDETIDLTMIQVYPNPNTGLFSVQYNLTTSNTVSIKITDILGKEIYFNTKLKQPSGLYTEHLDLDLPNGIYTIMINAGNLIETKKVIINK